MSSQLATAQYVVAVIVAFQPKAELFSRLLASLRTEVDCVIVVDNAREAGLENIDWNSTIERIDMKGNAGVGAAQNAGIRRAIARGASHVLILDHDSVPLDGMTRLLLETHTDLTKRDIRVAAVGANYQDSRQAKSSPFIVMGTWGFRRADADQSTASVPVSFLISAGSLIGVDAIADVGLMDESLFIDYVDIEWCLRARNKGRQCFGVPRARLEHELGDGVLSWREGDRPIKWRGRSVSARSPLRHYYMFRNACRLVVHSTMPLRWKLLESKRLIACFGAYALFATRRRHQISAMLTGALDGLKGKAGPVDALSHHWS